MASAGCAKFSHGAVPSDRGCGEPWETGLREPASLATVRWCCLTGCTQAVTRKRHTIAITQHSERVTDFTVSMPRTPLNFPHVRQMKLTLYFATLQVTETQLPLLLTRFHPPEFRQLRCLSELPCLFSLLYPRGEPARASRLALLSRAHLSERFSSPWKTFCVGLRSPHAEASNEELA